MFASKGGAPTDPDWYHHVRAHPEASVEIATERHQVVARIARGEERERIWRAQKAAFPWLADYEQSAGRPEIAVVVLDPA